MPPLVSIIIPCFNAAPWLAEALESCFGQTHKNIQVILVDNNSTDDSLKIARNGRDPRLVITRCERNGASAARNVGLGLAKGDFIQFLDADDFLAPDKIETQLNQLADSPPTTIASGAWARFKDGCTDASFEPEPVWRDFQPDEFLIHSWLGGGMMPVFAWLTPRAIIADAGPWNESLTLNDDGEFFTRVILASSRIVFCENAKGFYRTRSNQTLSQRRDAVSIKSDFESIRLSCEHLLAADVSDKARHACASAYQRLVYRYYPNCRELTRLAERKISELGGAELPCLTKGAGKVIERLLGWKTLKRLQLFKRKFRRRAWN